MSEANLPLEEYDYIEIRSGAPFSSRVDDVEEHLQAADRCVATLKQTDSIRLMVLETWLFVDFSVRQMLMSALKLNEVNHEDYDLRYNLLPNSFHACVDLLLDIKLTNESLTPPETDKRVRIAPRKFLRFIRQEVEDFWDKLQEVKEDYYRKHQSDIVEKLEAGTPEEVDYYLSLENSLDDTERQRVSSTWLEAVSEVDDDWRRKAKQLNTARNKAAHSHNEADIAAKLGKHGGGLEEKVRGKCLEMLETLMGVVPADMEK